MITGDDILRAVQTNNAVVEEHDGDGTALASDLGVEVHSLAQHAVAYAEVHDDVPVAFMTGALGGIRAARDAA